MQGKIIQKQGDVEREFKKYILFEFSRADNSINYKIEGVDTDDIARTIATLININYHQILEEGKGKVIQCIGEYQIHYQ